MRVDECVKKGLLKVHEFPMETVQKELEMARKHLDNAERNLEFGMPDVAIVESYTSMFHSARALLFRDGFKERSHVCLMEYLKDRYTGLSDLTSALDIFRINRHECLYGIDYEPIDEDASAGLEYAREFLNRVKGELEKDM